MKENKCSQTILEVFSMNIGSTQHLSTIGRNNPANLVDAAKLEKKDEDKPKSEALQKLDTKMQSMKEKLTYVDVTA